MLNVKSEVLQETTETYVYDTKVDLSGPVDSLLGESATVLCKIVETLTENLEEEIGGDVQLEVKKVLLDSIHSLAKEILYKGTGYKI